MVVDGVLACMADEEVDKAVWDANAELCSAWCRLLAVVGEHDRRALWRLSGSTGEAAHLKVVLSVSWRTANDWVRVAHALDRQPSWARAFAAGDLSVDQLVSMVAIAEAQSAGACAPLGPFDDPPPDPGPGSGPDPAGDPPADPAGDGAGDGAGDPSASPEGADGCDGTDPGEPNADPTGPAPAGGVDPSEGPDPAGGAGVHSAEELVELARLSPAQLNRLARRSRLKARQEADRLHRRRRVRAYRDEAASSLALDGMLYDDDAATLASALDAYLARGTTNAETGHYDPLELRLADAVVDMARAYLSATGGRDPRPTVVVHADARVLTGEDGWAETTGWSPLAAETVRRLACFCKLNVVAEGPDGVPVGVGREQRLAPDWLAELVRHRDGGCRFGGCGRTMFTQIHHIIPWDDPRLGRTDLNAMCEQCSEHHHLLHEGGWRIEGDPNAELRFISPSGEVVSSYPANPGPPRKRGSATAGSDAKPGSATEGSATAGSGAKAEPEPGSASPAGSNATVESGSGVGEGLIPRPGPGCSEHGQRRPDHGCDRPPSRGRPSPAGEPTLFDDG